MVESNRTRALNSFVDDYIVFAQGKIGRGVR